MSDKPEELNKPQPPTADTVILRNIQIAVEASLKELTEQGKTQNKILAESLQQGETLHETLNVLLLSMKTQQDSKELLQQIVDELSQPLPEEHTYTIEVRLINLLHPLSKEDNMAVEPGKGRGFGAFMQDNGNNIDLPDGSKFTWTTDDPSDQIAVSADSVVAVITVNPPAGSSRTTLVATAAAVDPTGTMISGSVTVQIIPGVEHTYTIGVAEVQINPLRRHPDHELPSGPGGGNKPGQGLPASPGPKK